MLYFVCIHISYFHILSTFNTLSICDSFINTISTSAQVHAWQTQDCNCIRFTIMQKVLVACPHVLLLPLHAPLFSQFFRVLIFLDPQNFFVDRDFVLFYAQYKFKLKSQKRSSSQHHVNVSVLVSALQCYQRAWLHSCIFDPYRKLLSHISGSDPATRSSTQHHKDSPPPPSQVV